MISVIIFTLEILITTTQMKNKKVNCLIVDLILIYLLIDLFPFVAMQHLGIVRGKLFKERFVFKVVLNLF